MKIKDLIVSPCNVREIKEDDEGIAALSESIKGATLISRLILRPGKNNKFEVVAGQRRYLAIKSIMREDAELPEDYYVLMTDLDDKQANILSITENQQRLELSPVELNRAILTLNKLGFKDKEVCKTLNITPNRFKRLSTLAQDIKKLPEEGQAELHKTVEESKFNDSHLEKVKNIENVEILKDVVDFIIEKEAPPRDVPTIIKAAEKNYEKENPPLGGDGDAKKTTYTAPEEASEPMEYKHKGELSLVLEGGTEKLVVKGKGEDEEIPLEHYKEFLKYPGKFKCYVTFKLVVKPVD